MAEPPKEKGAECCAIVVVCVSYFIKISDIAVDSIRHGIGELLQAMRLPVEGGASAHPDHRSPGRANGRTSAIPPRGAPERHESRCARLAVSAMLPFPDGVAAPPLRPSGEGRTNAK